MINGIDRDDKHFIANSKFLKFNTYMAFSGGLEDKASACNAGDIRMRVWPLGQEDPLEEGLATHSSILAWRIPWAEKSGGLQSTGSQRVGHNWAIELKYLVFAIIHISTVSNSCCVYRNWSEEDTNGRVPGTVQYLWILIIVRNCTSLYGLMLSHFSHVQLFVVLWTVARQASLPMGFSRQEYWSGCHSLL